MATTINKDNPNVKVIGTLNRLYYVYECGIISLFEYKTKPVEHISYKYKKGYLVFYSSL